MGLRDERAEHGGDVHGPLYAAAKLQKAPRVVAGHVLVAGAGKGGKMADGVFHRPGQRQRTVRLGRHLPDRGGMEGTDVAPRIAREVGTGAFGIAVDRVERLPHAVGLGMVEGEAHDAVAQGRGRGVGHLVFETQRQQPVQQFRLAVETGRIDHALDHHLEHAQRDLGTLGVAAKPEQIVGNAAEQIAARPAQMGGPATLVEQRRGARIAGLRVRIDNPHILGDPAPRQRGDAALRRREREATRHAAVAAGRCRHEQAHRIGRRLQLAVALAGGDTGAERAPGDEPPALA